jgi:hypothetical protein
VNMVMNQDSIKGKESLGQLSDYQLLKKGLCSMELVRIQFTCVIWLMTKFGKTGSLRGAHLEFVVR